jgi:hypothetical protein
MWHITQRLDQFDEFLGAYGNKITALLADCFTDIEVLKRIHLMPSLEELDANFTYTRVAKNEKINLRIKLRIFRVQTYNSIRDWNFLSYFKFDELEILKKFAASVDETEIDVIEELRDLKRLKMNFCYVHFDLEKNLKNLQQLESLELQEAEKLNEENLQNCLKNLKNLKNLSLSKILNKTFETICDNLMTLCTLEVEFSENILVENLQKLSNLQCLEDLKFNGLLPQAIFKNLSKVELPNLQS